MPLRIIIGRLWTLQGRICWSFFFKLEFKKNSDKPNAFIRRYFLDYFETYFNKIISEMLPWRRSTPEIVVSNEAPLKFHKSSYIFRGNPCWVIAHRNVRTFRLIIHDVGGLKGDHRRLSFLATDEGVFLQMRPSNSRMFHEC